MDIPLHENKKTLYKYKAFGLKISSEIILEELLEENFSKEDVTIKLGKVPEAFENAIIHNQNIIIGKNKFILDNQDIAKYFIENGNNITLELYKCALFEAVKLYLLGSCMGALLYQRRVLPLHGSCINISGQGILLTGHSGAGKSTIGRSLLDKGYKMITDDVAAIKLNNCNEPIAYPSYPSQKLWDDAINRIGQEVEIKSLNRISSDLNKYSVANHDLFYNEPLKLKIIFEIIPVVSNKITFEEITGVEKLNIVIKNTYRRSMIIGFDINQWHFEQCVKIANNVLIYRIRRPKGMHLENEIACDILEKIL